MDPEQQKQIVKLYIPIWLYSNNLEKNYLSVCQNPLHSNLVIFKFHFFIFVNFNTQLYIPIWLYSNSSFNAPYLALSIFTFQSGYIQIELEQGEPYIFVIFTFQSGYIQIRIL